MNTAAAPTDHRTTAPPDHPPGKGRLKLARQREQLASFVERAVSQDAPPAECPSRDNVLEHEVYAVRDPRRMKVPELDGFLEKTTTATGLPPRLRRRPRLAITRIEG